MGIRKIVQIDEEKCDGCGLCVPDCAEGALEIIDGKAKLSSDVYCDGLGACLGACPLDAIKIIEREADDFSEEAVEKRVKVNKAQNQEKKDEHQCQCPSSAPKNIEREANTSQVQEIQSRLTNWPLQITLAPPVAPYFENANLLIAADCVPFAYANFHNLLKDKVVLIGCPKLDDFESYVQKLASILKENEIRSVTVAHMEVPCCFGMVALTKEAIEKSTKDIKLEVLEFGISGEKH